MTFGFAIQAHPTRAKLAQTLSQQLGGAPIAWSRKPQDTWDTHRRARLAADPAADWNVVLQDDAVLGREFHRRLAELVASRPEQLYCLFYRPKSTRQGNGPYNDAAARGLASGGFAWPALRSCIGTVIATPLIADMIEYCDAITDVPSRLDDPRISRWAQERELPIWYPLPSLVNHQRGGRSLVGHGPNGSRVARWFA